jgi:hypothetical protein
MVSVPILGLSLIISLFGGSLGYVYILTYKLQVMELSAIIFAISYCVLALFL